MLFRSNSDEIQAKIKNLNEQIKVATLEFDKTLAQISRILFTLSEQVIFEFNVAKIPLEFWLDVEKQFNKAKQMKSEIRSSLNSNFGSFKEVSNDIKTQIDRFYALCKNHSKNRTMQYFIENNLIKLDGLYVDDLFAIKTEIPNNKYQKIEYTIRNKYTYIGIVVSTFIGIFLVYVRVLLQKIWRERGLLKAKDELLSALKYWKP